MAPRRKKPDPAAEIELDEDDLDQVSREPTVLVRNMFGSGIQVEDAARLTGDLELIATLREGLLRQARYDAADFDAVHAAFEEEEQPEDQE